MYFPFLYCCIFGFTWQEIHVLNYSRVLCIQTKDAAHVCGVLIKTYEDIDKELEKPLEIDASTRKVLILIYHTKDFYMFDSDMLHNTQKDTHTNTKQFSNSNFSKT